MSWTGKEKAAVAMYRRQAGLGDYEYRVLLFGATGARSARDRGLGRRHFLAAMAALDEVASAAGPFPANWKWQPGHWSTQHAQAGLAVGLATPQQLFVLRELVDAVALWQKIEDPSKWLAGFCEQVLARSGRERLDGITQGEASRCIEAAKLRLREVVRRGGGGELRDRLDGLQLAKAAAAKRAA